MMIVHFRLTQLMELLQQRLDDVESQLKSELQDVASELKDVESELTTELQDVASELEDVTSELQDVKSGKCLPNYLIDIFKG